MTGGGTADRSGEGGRAQRRALGDDYLWGAKNEAKQVSEEWDA